MSKICLLCGDTFPDNISFCAKDGSALRAAVVGDHLIGEVFCDRYVVTDLLGEGGMGAVYAARDVRLPQQVAIKVLREQVMADPTTVARFRQEAEAASRINHDRVARVTDFGFMTDGRAYLVMEYVGGQTLKQIITERGPMSVVDTSRIVTMVAEGLDAAHRLGIVHRDLKPDNVMILDDAGGGVRVKVLDFGIAKVLHANEESAGQTKTGFVIGTPQWMSPEQILGEKLDARSDLYSLALLAYFMLTGRRAFESATAEAEMMARLSSPPRQLAEVVPNVVWPTGLQELFNRTLSRDVNVRPSGALAFAKEFTNVAATASNMGASGYSTAAVDARVIATGATQSSMQPTAPLAVAGASSASSASRLGAVTPSVPVQSAVSGSSNTLDAATNAKRSKAVPVALGVAAMAAVAFFAVRQFTGSSNAPPNTAPGLNNLPTVAASSNDTVGRGTGSTPNATMPTNTASGGNPQPTTSSPTAVDPKDGATGNAARTGRSQIAGATGGNSTKPATSRGAPPASAGSAGGSNAVGATTSGASASGANASGANASGANAAPGTTAHTDLLKLMNVADAVLDGHDTDAIRDIMRKLEQLAPRLTTATDQGYIHFYTAMSHATLGDNAKACTSLSRAEPLAVQSPALSANVQQWHQQLRCVP